MKVTKEYLNREVERVAPLLSAAEIRAEVVDDAKGGHIELADLQGAPFDDMETRWFYSAHDITERLDCVFRGLYLNGSICCDAEKDFDSYEEAEVYARDTGYIAEAENIRLLMELQAEPDCHVFPDALLENMYIMTDDELRAAYFYNQDLYYEEDMDLAMERLVYGAELENCEEEQVAEGEKSFTKKYGLTAAEASMLVKEATRQFSHHYDANEDYNSQMDYWAEDTVKKHRKAA